MVVGRVPVEATRLGVVLAGQAVQLVLGLARPQTGGTTRLDVLGDGLPVDLIVVRYHVALVVAARQQHAELAHVGIKAVRQDQLAFVFLTLAQFDIAAAGLAGDAQARIVEGRTGDDVDVAGDGLAGHVGRHGLADHDLRGNGRGQAVITGVAALGADDRDAADGQGRPVHRRTAQADVAGLALVAGNGGTRQASDGLGDVLVGQAAHRVRGHDGHERVGVALHPQGGRLGFRDRAIAHHNDIVQLGRRLRSGLGEGSAGKGERRERCAEQKSKFHNEHPDGPDAPTVAGSGGPARVKGRRGRDGLTKQAWRFLNAKVTINPEAEGHSPFCRGHVIDACVDAPEAPCSGATCTIAHRRTPCSSAP